MELQAAEEGERDGEVGEEVGGEGFERGGVGIGLWWWWEGGGHDERRKGSGEVRVQGVRGMLAIIIASDDYVYIYKYSMSIL